MLIVYLLPIYPLRAQEVTRFIGNKTLEVSPNYVVAVDHANACADENSCAGRYYVDDQTAVNTTIKVTSVRVDGDTTSMIATLSDEPKSADALVFVIADYLVPDPAAEGKLKHTGRKNIAIKPHVTSPTDLPDTIVYESLTPLKLNSHIAAEKAITISDPDDFDRPYPARVDSVENVSHFVHNIHLAGLPRGKKLDVVVSGLDVVGKPVTVKSSLKTGALPKTRDEAQVWISAGIDADNVKDERKYKLDARLHRDVISGRWKIGPTLDATIGNRTSKAPNSGSLSADFRYFFGASNKDKPGLLTDHAFLFAPTFRGNRTLSNRDLGIDLAWEPRFTALEKTLNFRRTAAKGTDRDPFAIAWGFTLRPVIALEMGRHLKSESPDVEHTDFSRIRGDLALTVERETLSLTLTGTTRHLMNDELVRDDTGTVVRTDRSDRRFFRGDLTWDFGYAAITLSHLNGQRPPAFTHTHTTSLGVAFKW